MDIMYELVQNKAHSAIHSFCTMCSLLLVLFSPFLSLCSAVFVCIHCSGIITVIIVVFLNVNTTYTILFQLNFLCCVCVFFHALAHTHKHFSICCFLFLLFNVTCFPLSNLFLVFPYQIDSHFFLLWHKCKEKKISIFLYLPIRLRPFNITISVVSSFFSYPVSFKLSAYVFFAMNICILSFF